MAAETDPFPSVPPPPRSPSIPPDLRAGMIVAGKYELVRRLGAGAMGEVWAARHRSLDEEVAIKLVLRNVDHDDGTSSESRFLLEARVSASLSRKTRHIVGVTDHGEDGAMAYLVMELLEGESLDARILRTGPKEIGAVVPIVQQIARGLSVAHAEGIVHRDLKPSNVFVTIDEDGAALVKILDFGIAKLRASARRIAIPTVSAAKHATMRGMLLGTPAYMSPEQARGRLAIDHRADVWALAVIAYHLLTSEYPFDAETTEELFARIQRADAIPIRARRPELPPIVEDFFRRAFAPRIDDRFQSALALSGAFEQLEPLARQEISVPPPRMHLLADAPPLTRDSAPEGDELVPAPRSARPSRPALDTIAAAGVPRRGLGAKIFAGGLVAAVVLGTAAIVGLYLEREPPKPAGISLSAAVALPVSTRDEIPPAATGGALSAVRASDLPEAKPAPTPRSQVTLTSGPLRVAPTPPAPTPPAPTKAADVVTSAPPPSAPPPRAPRAIDKGEIL